MINHSILINKESQGKKYLEHPGTYPPTSKMGLLIFPPRLPAFFLLHTNATLIFYPFVPVYPVIHNRIPPIKSRRIKKKWCNNHVADMNQMEYEDVNQADWSNMCDWFEPDEFQKLSVTNTESRKSKGQPLLRF